MGTGYFTITTVYSTLFLNSDTDIVFRGEIGTGAYHNNLAICGDEAILSDGHLSPGVKA